MSNAPIDLNEIFNPTRTFFGYDVRTGEPIFIPRSAYLGRSAELIGPSGAGKTDRLIEDLRSVTLSPAGYVYYDFADTGFDQARLWDAYIAEFLGTSVEIPYAENVEEFRGITSAFVGRHGYAVVGGPNPPIRINPLRRCVFPDGSVESIEDVVGRMERVFGAQYDDFSERVLFRRNLRMVVALLAAAGRELVDWSLLLGDDSMFRKFVISEIERLGTAGDPFVVRQRENLAAHLALSPRDRREEVSSFVNSFEPFAAGSIAAFLSNENFPLEEVIYGGRRLFLSVSGLNGTEQKKFIMRIVWAACDTLIAKRRYMDQAPIGVEFIDEISWLPVDFFDVLTRRRNYRWSSITARQDVRQFETLGFKNAERLSEASAATRILWKVATLDEAKELAIRMDAIEPDGWWIERIVESLATAETHGSSIAHTQSTTIVDTQTKTTGWADGTKYDPFEVVTGTSKGRTGSDGVTRGSHVGDGTAAGTNTATTETVSRSPQLFRLGFDEQQSLRGQALIRKPRHVAIVDTIDEVRPVLMNRARQLPFDETGQLVVETYIRLNHEIHEARTVRVPPFNPPIHVLTAAPADLGRADAARENRAPAVRPTRTGPTVPDGGAITSRRAPVGSQAATPAAAEVESPTAAAGRQEAGSPTTTAGGATRAGKAGGTTRVDVPDEPLAPAFVPVTFQTDDLATRLLWWALFLRYLTVADAIHLVKGSSYDTVKRLLDLLTTGATPGLVSFTPPAARGVGSTPAVYTLTGHGATALAAHGMPGLEWMQGVARTVAKRRRDVEAGAATHLVHDLDVVHLTALVIGFIVRHDPEASIDHLSWGAGFIVPLPSREVLERLPEKFHRALRGGGDGQTAYVPDVLLAVRWRPDGVHLVSEVLALEVETGFSGADGQEKGALRAARVGVAQKRALQTGKLGALCLATPPRFRVITWAKTPEFEAGLLAGTESVARAAKNDMWFTNGDLLPLTLPKGTVKKDIPATLQAMADALDAASFTSIRSPQTRVGLWTGGNPPRAGERPGQ